MSFDSLKNTNTFTKEKLTMKETSLSMNVSPKNTNTTENVNIQEGLSADKSQDVEYIRLGAEHIDNVITSVEYNTSAGPIDNNELEEEPATSVHTQDEVKMRRTQAQKRMFNPGQYTKIRNQMMGNSCHSNSSRAGAIQNQKQY